MDTCRGHGDIHLLSGLRQGFRAHASRYTVYLSLSLRTARLPEGSFFPLFFCWMDDLPGGEIKEELGKPDWIPVGFVLSICHHLWLHDRTAETENPSGGLLPC